LPCSCRILTTRALTVTIKLRFSLGFSVAWLTSVHCRSCEIARGTRNVEGGIIQLGTCWMANHYQDSRDRFLGWLVLQPKKHRVDSSEMTSRELREFGGVSQRLETALKRACDSMFFGDRVEIVYVVRLAESTVERRPQWHLHWHMIPRTRSMGRMGALGWNIGKARRMAKKRNPTAYEIQALMDRIRASL